MRAFVIFSCCLLVLGAVSGIFYFIYDINRVNVDYSSWAKGIGTVTHVNYGRGSAGEMEYLFKGEKYNGAGRMSCGDHLGEKYVIRINPNKPDDYIPLSWLPTFEANEETYEAVGKIIRIFRFRLLANNVSRYALIYTYHVNDVEHKASQDLPPGYEKDELHVNQYFKVQFGGSPSRAIIHLDMPLKRKE